MSVAQLGFAVDSAPLVGASKALTELTAAAKPAAVAAADLSKAASAGTSTLAAHTNATKANASAHAGLSTQAMAAQHSIRSMVEQLAMGIPPTQVLTSQMNHLSYAASGPGGLKGAFTEALGAFRSFLSPMALIGGGLAAIGIGAALAVNGVTKLVLKLDDAAHVAGTTTAQMNGLAASASLKGIDNSDFFTAIEKFSGFVYDAKNNMGGLADVLRANHQRAGDLVQDFGSISNLIKGAAGNTQLQFSILQQSGLPATMQWVRFLSQGGDAIKAQAAEFDKNGAQMDTLVAKAREFDDAWNKTTTNISQYFKGMVVDIAAALSGIQVPSWLTTLSGYALKAGSLVAGMIPGGAALSAGANALGNRLTTQTPAQPYEAGFIGPTQPMGPNLPSGSSKSPVDPNALQHQMALEQQHIGLLGQTATASDAVRSVELQVAQARLAGVSITSKQVDVLKQLAAEQNLGITQIKSQIDSYNVEAATVGMSAGAAAQYAAAQNAINDAKRAGRALTQDNIAAINAQAQALGDAAAKADLMNTAYSGLVRGPLQTLTSQIANGAKFFDALKAAGVSALSAIANKLADMAAQSLWTSAFGGASSGGGLLGLLGLGGTTSTTGLGGLAAIHHAGGVVGDGTAPNRYIHSAYFDDAPRYHSGGIAGLAPDEVPAILQRGERVIPRGQSGSMGTGSAQGVHVTVGVSVDNDGNLQAYVKDVAQQTTATGVNAALSSPQFVNRVANASKQAASRRLAA